MKPSLFQVPPHVVERLSGGGRKRQGIRLEEPADVVGSKPDSLEVERRDRSREGFTFFKESPSCSTVGLLLDDGDEVPDAGLGGLLRICSIRHGRVTNLSNFTVSING
jgi:hypothetical protein